MCAHKNVDGPTGRKFAIEQDGPTIVELKVAEILRRPYRWVLVPQHDCVFATIEEFPGCITEGDTLEQAVVNLRDAAETWLSVVLERERTVPEPKDK